jgi:hypothetical protein
MHTNNIPNVPLPASADEVYDWEDPGSPGAQRYFEGCRRSVPTGGDPIDMFISPMQYADGNGRRIPVTRRIRFRRIRHEKRQRRSLAGIRCNRVGLAPRVYLSPANPVASWDTYLSQTIPDM